MTWAIRVPHPLILVRKSAHGWSSCGETQTFLQQWPHNAILHLGGWIGLFGGNQTENRFWDVLGTLKLERKIRKPENQHVSAINFPKTSSHLHREGNGRQAPERLNGDLFSPPVRTMMGLSWQPRTPSSFCQSWHKPTTRKKPCGSKHVLGIFNWS